MNTAGQLSPSRSPIRRRRADPLSISVTTRTPGLPVSLYFFGFGGLSPTQQTYPAPSTNGTVHHIGKDLLNLDKVIYMFRNLYLLLTRHRMLPGTRHKHEHKIIFRIHQYS